MLGLVPFHQRLGPWAVSETEYVAWDEQPFAMVMIFRHSYVKYFTTVPRPVCYEGNKVFCVRTVFVLGGEVSTVRNMPQYQPALDCKANITYLVLGGNDTDQQTRENIGY